MSDQNRDNSISSSEQEERLLGYEKGDEGFERFPSQRPSTFRTWWKWGLHLLMFGFNLGLSVYLLRNPSAGTAPTPERKCSNLRGHELDFAEDIISYEDKVFVASGFHEHDDAPPTEFEGFGFKHVDKAWENLTSGLCFLSFFFLATPSPSFRLLFQLLTLV